MIYCLPTLYRLLDDKRKEFGDAVTKLKNGLDKLIDTRKKVEAMTIELQDTRIKLTSFQKQCDEYLVVIVQQKRDAEEQEKTVIARSEKIAEEESHCLVLAEAAQKDLDQALPALERAMEALKALNKKDLGEIKSYPTPPELVETVMQAVMILRQSDPSWTEAKRQLGDPQFIKYLVEFDKNNMSDKGESLNRGHIRKNIISFCVFCREVALFYGGFKHIKAVSAL